MMCGGDWGRGTGPHKKTETYRVGRVGNLRARAGVGAGQKVVSRDVWDDQFDPAARAGRVARLLVLASAILGRGDSFDYRAEP